MQRYVPIIIGACKLTSEGFTPFQLLKDLSSQNRGHAEFFYVAAVDLVLEGGLAVFCVECNVDTHRMHGMGERSS